MDRFSSKSKQSAVNALILAAFAGFFAGCKTTVQISSDPPGSTVYDKGKVIGVTPLNIDIGDLQDKKAGGYMLTVEKSGYHRLSIWLPSWVNDLDIALNLQPFLVKASDNNQTTTTSASRRVVYSKTASLFKLQNRILSDRESGDETLKEVDTMLEENPSLGSLHFLKAVVLARQSKEAEARTSLEKAMQMSPREYDFLSMYNILGGGQSQPSAKDAAGSSATE